MLLYFTLECSALFYFSHNIILMFQEIVENQSLAHEEKNIWISNHCVISVKNVKELSTILVQVTLCPLFKQISWT